MIFLALHIVIISDLILIGNCSLFLCVSCCRLSVHPNSEIVTEIILKETEWFRKYCFRCC